MEDKIDFISSLGKITFFLMLILSIFLFTVKTTRKISNYLFGALLLLVAFDLTGFFIPHWIAASPNLNIIKTGSSLLQMPLFYLYVLSVCDADFKLMPRHVLHTLLFFVFLVILKVTSLNGVHYRLFEIVVELQWLTYMLMVFAVLGRQRRVHQENFSSPNSKAFTWLLQFTVFSCIAHSLVFIRWMFSYWEFNDIVLNLNIAISISTLLITTWFVFKALYYPQLFTGIQTALKPIKSSVGKVKNNYIKSAILKGDTKRLESFMQLEQPYLDFELTLQKLATHLDMPEKELSILINHTMGKHFFDFVNDYRIEHAKTILADPKEKKQTVLEVLYQVGFNSKSSFYTAFKKVTGQTPTDYKKEQLSHKNI